MAYPMISRAALMAAHAYSGQTDKSLAPILEHGIRVMLTVEAGGFSQEVRAAALLHDAVEGGRVTVEMIAESISERTAKLVEAVTYTRVMSRREYIDQIAHFGRDAIAIKLADISDNLDPGRLALLDSSVAQRLRLKYSTDLAALVPAFISSAP